MAKLQSEMAKFAASYFKFVNTRDNVEKELSLRTAQVVHPAQISAAFCSTSPHEASETKKEAAVNFMRRV